MDMYKNKINTPESNIAFNVLIMIWFGVFAIVFIHSIVSLYIYKEASYVGILACVATFYAATYFINSKKDVLKSIDKMNHSGVEYIPGFVVNPEDIREYMLAGDVLATFFDIKKGVLTFKGEKFVPFQLSSFLSVNDFVISVKLVLLKKRIIAKF